MLRFTRSRWAASVPAAALLLAGAASAPGCGGSDEAVSFADTTASTGTTGGSTATGTGGAGEGGASATSSTTGEGGATTGATTGVGGGATTGSGGGASGGIISQSNASVIEAETHLARSQSGVVAVAWIAIEQGGGSSNGYRFSKDDGATWEPPATIDSPGNRVASDPVLAVDAAGDFYLSWVGFVRDAQGNPTDMHVYVAKASAGTTTFGAPVEVTNPNEGASYDKPWVMVTPGGAVLVTYAKTSTGGIYAARSTDGGATFTRTAIAEDGNFRNLVYPCAQEGGARVYAVYHAGGGIGIHWSDDDGATWPDPFKAPVADPNEPTPAFDDPTCVAAGSDVWVSYGLSMDPPGEAESPKLNAIRIAHSPNGGQSIDWRAQAGDAAASTYFMHPALAREAGGALDVVYYGGASDGDAAGGYRRARSTDAGKTWAPSNVVAQPITFLQARGDPRWLGDYVGVLHAEGSLYTSYVDNSSGSSHVAFARIDGL